MVLVKVKPQKWLAKNNIYCIVKLKSCMVTRQCYILWSDILSCLCLFSGLFSPHYARKHCYVWNWCTGLNMQFIQLVLIHMHWIKDHAKSGKPVEIREVRLITYSVRCTKLQAIPTKLGYFGFLKRVIKKSNNKGLFTGKLMCFNIAWWLNCF